jgi:hypothetical protein
MMQSDFEAHSQTLLVYWATQRNLGLTKSALFCEDSLCSSDVRDLGGGRNISFPFRGVCSWGPG